MKHPEIPAGMSRKDFYQRAFDKMMAHAVYELERCLTICFREHQDVLVLVPHVDDRYLVQVADKDCYLIQFQLTERFRLNGPHHYTNGMGARLFPGKVLRHQSHEVTARRALIRALQTYRIPSERKKGFWPFSDPRGVRKAPYR
jgi:predicted class III extradiol MEMO1 family dioxygenase